MQTISIFGVRVAITDKENFKEYLLKLLTDNKTKLIRNAVVNGEFLYRFNNVDEFKNKTKDFELNIADGVGVLWAARYITLNITKVRFLKNIQAIWQMIYTTISLIFYPKFSRFPISEHIPGLERFHLTMQIIIKANSSVFIFGGEEEIIEKAITNLKKRYPSINIAGYRNGYNYEDRDIVEQINKSKAEVLIVAQGTPRQEYWIHKNADNLNYVKLAVGEGGTLDLVAQDIYRPHPFMQRRGLEWLYRLVTQKRNKTGHGSRYNRIKCGVFLLITNMVKYKIKNGAIYLTNKTN